MIAVLPILHTVYKISLEFFVSSARNRWENIIHLTKDNVKDGHSCNQRIRGLWTRKAGNQLNFWLSGCVNEAEKVIHPFADMNTWNSIEFGQVHLNIFFLNKLIRFGRLGRNRIYSFQYVWMIYY